MEDLVPKMLAKRIEAWRRTAREWRPHPYQERALKFMLEKPQSGLLLDPGMGKTSITLAAVKVLLQRGLVRRVLVVAPLRACYDVWPAEMADWRDFHNMQCAILHGEHKERTLRLLVPSHTVALINPEGVPWLVGSKERMKLLGADMLVVDESSKWKSSTTARFRSLRPALPTFKRRHILTGSPRPRNLLDLFGQMYILDRGLTLGAYVTHYRNTYFYPTGYKMREWEPLPDSEKRINKAVAPYVLRLDAKDYLKLPKTMEQTHRVELPPKVRLEYDAIEDSLMSSIFTQPLVNSAGARSKCCQIANGSVYLDSTPEELWQKERPVKVLHTAKVDALVDLYEELQGEPLLVSIGYHHDVVAVRKALGADIPCLNSRTGRNQAADIIERWNRGQLPLLMGHPASMGHALNLQKFSARHVAFFDIPDDYDYYDQAFRRVWRQGNKAEFVVRHHIVAVNTVDVAKMRNLKRKGTGQRDFLDAMRWYAEERRK